MRLDITPAVVMVDLPRMGSDSLRLQDIVELRAHPRFQAIIFERLLSPFVHLIMLLIAIPLLARGETRGPLAGILYALGICLLYQLVAIVGIHAAKTEYIAPVIGACIPPLAFGALGAYLTVRAET